MLLHTFLGAEPIHCSALGELQSAAVGCIAPSLLGDGRTGTSLPLGQVAATHTLAPETRLRRNKLVQFFIVEGLERLCHVFLYSSPTCVKGGDIWSGAGSCNAVGGRGRRLLQQTAQQTHCLLQQDLITAGQAKLQPPRPLCVRVCECGDILLY